MGGSDQWGNIVMGADLGRRMQGAELFALTSPLLTTASGAKMGKTAAGAVRASFGPETTLEDVDALAAALLEHRKTRFPML